MGLCAGKDPRRRITTCAFVTLYMHANVRAYMRGHALSLLTITIQYVSREPSPCSVSCPRVGVPTGERCPRATGCDVPRLRDNEQRSLRALGHRLQPRGGE